MKRESSHTNAALAPDDQSIVMVMDEILVKVREGADREYSYYETVLSF